VVDSCAEEVQAPKMDVGGQGEANATISHPRPSENDRDTQKASTWRANYQCLEQHRLVNLDLRV
jgi:hypothetical protein